MLMTCAFFNNSKSETINVLLTCNGNGHSYCVFDKEDGQRLHKFPIDGLAYEDITAEIEHYARKVMGANNVEYVADRSMIDQFLEASAQLERDYRMGSIAYVSVSVSVSGQTHAGKIIVDLRNEHQETVGEKIEYVSEKIKKLLTEWFYKEYGNYTYSCQKSHGGL